MNSRRGRFVQLVAFGGLVAVLVGGVIVLIGQSRAKPGCGPAVVSDGVRLTVEPRSSNALIADASVELSSAAPIYLEYGNNALGWLRTPTTASGTVHHLPIVRLRAQTLYQVRAFALDRNGCAVAGAAAELTTDRSPPQFQKLVVE